MKNLFFLSLIFLVACGDDSQIRQMAAPVTIINQDMVGVWASNAGTLTIQSNGTGTESTCGYRFRYSFESESANRASVNFYQSDEKCPMTVRSCLFFRDGDSLSFDCGDGVVQYSLFNKDLLSSQDGVQK